jgi:hypothetical protein
MCETYYFLAGPRQWFRGLNGMMGIATKIFIARFIPTLLCPVFFGSTLWKNQHLSVQRYFIAGHGHSSEE